MDPTYDFAALERHKRVDCMKNLRSYIQLRAEELLLKQLKASLSTNANGRELWTPIKPTIDFLTTVGISSGSVLGEDNDYESIALAYEDSG